MADAQKWQSLRQAFCFHHAAAIIIITCREEREREKKRVSHFASHLNKCYLITQNTDRPTFPTFVPNCTSVSRKCTCRSYFFSFFPSFLPSLHFRTPFPPFFFISHVKLSEYPVWLWTWNGTKGILRSRNSRATFVFPGGRPRDVRRFSRLWRCPLNLYADNTLYISVAVRVLRLCIYTVSFSCRPLCERLENMRLRVCHRCPFLRFS